MTEILWNLYHWVTTYLLCCEGVLQQTVGIYIDAYIRRVRRCQRGYQNTQSEEGQTTQWSKEKVQKDKQRATKQYTQNWQTTIYKTLHTKLTNNNLQNTSHKTKDQATRTPLTLKLIK